MNKIKRHFSILGQGGGKTRMTPGLSAYLANAGKRGSAARVKSMTAEQRSAQARKASMARWGRR